MPRCYYVASEPKHAGGPVAGKDSFSQSRNNLAILVLCKLEPRYDGSRVDPCRDVIRGLVLPRDHKTMVTCPNCKNQVFPVVEMCPRCGRTLKDQSSLGPLAYVYALMVPIGILIWYLDFGPWGALLGFAVTIIGVAFLLYRAIFLPW